MIQLCLTRGGIKWQDSHVDHRAKFFRSQCEIVAVTVPHLVQAVTIPDMTVALTRTPTSHLHLSFDESDRWAITASGSHRQRIMDQGFLLNSLLCGQSICERAGSIRKYPSITTRVAYEEFRLSCGEVSEASFAAICSAIVEVVNTSNVRINVDSVGAGAWQWLAYTICCGTSSIRSLTIWEATLMKSDITAIANVLKFCYPKPPSTLHSPEYGYVTIQEGAEIWPSGLTEGNDCPFILSSECRCRALFTGGGDVEIVIPGYGICRTKLGERISHETRDSHGMQFRTNLVCSTRSVTLYLNKVESVPLVVDLLAFIGENLRTLQLSKTSNDNPLDASLDLTALSTVCPHLEVLVTQRFDIIVSEHNESLRVWPLKDLTIRRTYKLAGVVACLRNPALRMTRELLEVWLSQEGGVYDEDELRELESHHGEYLPVVKEKVPIDSKTAMISTVMYAKHVRAIHHLDANILSLIFVLASTPAQRVVQKR